jgi:histidinol-phosphate aminotransferase
MRTNPNVETLSPYRPGKPMDELTRELGITDIVKLASNENPRGPSRPVREAIERTFGGLSRYPDGNGFRLKQALAARLEVTPDRITLGNGSNDVLDLAAAMSLTPGASGVIAEHAFVVYSIAITVCGGRVVRVPAVDHGADLDAMLARVDDSTAIVFLANPNNPTGTWVNEDALTAFLDALPPHVWMVLDEAYFEYVNAPGYPDGLKLLDRYPNLIVTRTFSKIYGLAGLRVGYAVSSVAAADLMNRARAPFNVNSLALAGAEAALADDAYVAESRRLNQVGMAELTTVLDGMGIEHIPSAGNFVTFQVPERFAAGSHNASPAAAVYEALLREGVIVRPVAEYGLPRHLRVTIGLAEENARFLDALVRVLA